MPFTILALLMLSLSVAALAQTPGDENGTGQVGISSESSELTSDVVAATEKPKAADPGPGDEGRDLFYYLRIIGLSLAILVSSIAIYKFFKHKEYEANQPRGDGTHVENAKDSVITGGDHSPAIKSDHIEGGVHITYAGSTEPLSSGELPGKISNIPYPHNPNFTGRVDLLDRLHDALTSGQYAAFTQTQAITGLGGVGKTQLALEYTYRRLADYEAIWWVRSEEPATLAADYASLAAKLDLPEKTSADQGVIIEAVRIWLEQNGGWLLVFDNAQNPEDLKDYLPRAGGGHVIITSRNPNWGGIVRTLPVDVFSRVESIEFLRSRTAQEDGADALGDALGDLPLALEQAGAYVNETGISLSDYLNRFQERHKEILERGKPTSYPDTVATTWKISFQQVQEESGAGADLLNLSAFLAPDNIPKPLMVGGAQHLSEHLASAVADELKFDDAVAALKRYSLVTVADASLSVHRLVQAVTRDRLEVGDRKKWSEVSVQLVNAAFPRGTDDFHNWPVCSPLLPHALAASGHAEELGVAPKTTGYLLNRIGIYLYVRAEYKESKSAWERALEIKEKVYGPDHPEVAITLGNLGLVLQQLGDYEGAKERLERALVIEETVYGPDHPEVAITLTNLGNVLRQLGDYEGAKEHQERALRIFRDKLGEDYSYTKTVRGNLEALQHR